MKESAAGKTIVIEPRRPHRRLLRELWDYRELFLFLSWRDILVRYKQTLLGILWSVLRPLLTIIIFTLVFGRLAKLPSQGIPYAVLVFAAMLPWQLFANALSESSNSLIGNAHLISKVYFPRLIIPITSIMVGLIDFLISLVILLGVMAFYRFWPDYRILVMPLFLGQTLLFALGCSFWFSALNVKYRDVRYIIPFLVQLGLYISPVGFSSAVIPDRWRLLYSLNPLVGIIDGFRWSLLRGRSEIYLPGLWLSMLLVLVIAISGFMYFRRVERSFADII